MTIVAETYTNWTERQSLAAQYEARGYRMLHDDFASDWKRGDEPYGRLTFTDEPAPVVPTPSGYEPSNPGDNAGKRIEHIEQFLLEKFG